MQELLVEQISKALVDAPEEVSVTKVEGSRLTVFELRVAKADLGKVIGKGGQTARSIRTILAAIAKKDGKKAVLEIIE